MNFKNELFTDLSIGIEHHRPTPLSSVCCKACKSETIVAYTASERITAVEKYFWASQRFAYMNILVHEKGAPFMWKQWKAEVIHKILF